MRQIILASGSKYRKELLSQLNIPFETASPNVDEEPYKNKGLSPKELAMTLAKLKAQSLKEQFPEAIIIGGDQVACLDQKIFSKPGTEQAATAQLSELSGKTHELMSAISIWSKETEAHFINVTNLEMHELTAEQISRYVKHDMPLDCAGSYKIEGLGISLFKNIFMNDYTAIIGIPLMELASTLRQKWNISIP
jgi:septum formation protein